MHSSLRLVLASSATFAFASIASANNIVTFNSLAAGTQYGPAHSPGDLVLTEDGVGVRVETFLFTVSGSAFNVATVANNAAFFPTNYVSVNNINLNFDYTGPGIGFTPNLVTFEYIDQGGFENFSVNGAALYRGELSAVPAAWGSVNVSVGAPVAVPGGSKRVVTLTGPVNSLIVGGQEFGIDSVNAVPTPSAAWVIAGAAVIGGARRRRAKR